MSETEHTGLPVEGYKPQSIPNVDLVNRNKKLEELVLKIIDEFKVNTNIEQRWLALAKTHIETGFMCLNRSVFQPDRAKVVEGDKLKVNSLVVEVRMQGEGD